MSAAPAGDHRGYVGIGEVLAQLRSDFPDITVSKIRFLETEGLIEPARSAGGYRRFAVADVDRLRRVLVMQRDQYLPLRVIRERLSESAAPPATPVPHSASRDHSHAGPDRRPLESVSPPLTRRELLSASGVSDALLTDLETFGLVSRAGQGGRQYRGEAVEVARAARALTEYGVAPRHLRAVLASADREVTLIEQVVAPMLRQRGPGGRAAAATAAAQIAALAERLHRALVETALAEAGFRPPGPAVDGAL